jgi:hypothetical protein
MQLDQRQGPAPDSSPAQPYTSGNPSNNSSEASQFGFGTQTSNPPSTGQPQSRRFKHLKLLGFFILFEAVMFGYSYVVGHGRIQDFLAWITSSQLVIILLVLMLVWVTKHKDKYYQSTGSVPSLNRSGKTHILLGTLIIIALVVFWAIGIFPALIKLSLKKDGVDSVALVQSYELVDKGSRGAEFNASSVAQADALNVKLTYNNRTSTISIQKDDPAFNQVYSAATQTGDEVPVRYLRLIPSIVLAKTDLGLPNSANIKPNYISSTAPAKTPKVSQTQINSSITMANQFLAYLQQGNFQAAHSLETPYYQNRYNTTFLQNEYQGMNLAGYTYALMATGTGISPGGFVYVDILYKYTQPNNLTPYYVKVWIENDSRWGIGLIGGSLDLQYLNTPDLKLSMP